MTSSAAPDLKPCPFCGGTALIARSPYASDYMAGCTECDMAGQSGFQTEENAIESWNTRADLAVKVKPLEWGYHPAGAIAADTIGMSYIIDTRGTDRPSFLEWPGEFAPDVETLESAKATAQADYETRILSALEFIAPPATGGAE